MRVIPGRTHRKKADELMAWRSTDEERCVYAGGKSVQMKKCREEGRSLQETLVECWKEEITEK